MTSESIQGQITEMMGEGKRENGYKHRVATITGIHAGGGKKSKQCLSRRKKGNSYNRESNKTRMGGK